LSVGVCNRAAIDIDHKSCEILPAHFRMSIPVYCLDRMI